MTILLHIYFTYFHLICCYGSYIYQLYLISINKIDLAKYTINAMLSILRQKSRLSIVILVYIINSAEKLDNPADT